jgi:hypothetical protein
MRILVLSRGKPNSHAIRDHLSLSTLRDRADFNEPVRDQLLISSPAIGGAFDVRVEDSTSGRRRRHFYLRRHERLFAVERAALKPLPMHIPHIAWMP